MKTMSDAPLPVPRMIKAENVAWNQTSTDKKLILTEVEIWHIKYFLFYFKYKLIKPLSVHENAGLFKCTP